MVPSSMSAPGWRSITFACKSDSNHGCFFVLFTFFVIPSLSKVEPTHFFFTKFNYYMIIFLGKKTLIIMHVKQIPMMPIARVSQEEDSMNNSQT